MARRPSGDDPRIALGSAELEAASQGAYPQVGSKASRMDYGMLAIVAAAFGIGALTWITLTSQQPQKAQAPVQVAEANPMHVQATPVPAPKSPPAAPEQATIPPKPPGRGAAVAEDSHAPAMIVDNSTPREAASFNKAKSAPTHTAPLLDPDEQFAARFNPSGENKSSPMADPAQTVPQGTIIPAVLETALDSDLPGFARAIVSRDIRGFDGTKILVPRGSRLIGQYKSGLSSGVTRAFIVWERLIRPDGVSIQLGSPATDELGRTGLSGEVDTHFLKRFGSAILLSVVTGLANSNSTSAIVIGSSSGAQSAASDALSIDAKIPPTIKVMQGTVIRVFVAHDLHFGN